MGILKRKTANSADVSPPEDIRGKLNKAEYALRHAYHESANRLTGYNLKANNWDERVGRVSKLLFLAKTDEAKEDLSVMRKQAKDYQTHFTTLAVQEAEYKNSLATQYETVKKALDRFATMDRRLHLAEEIRRMSAGLGEPSSDSKDITNNIDLREIEHLIHTSIALLELKEQKAIKS